MDRRHPQTARLETSETRVFSERAHSGAAFGLDRRSVKSWIALVALTLFVMLVGGCSSQEDGAGSGESALGAKGRWSPPTDVLAVGAKVRIAYEDAPKWSGTAACGGRLLAGGHKLGEYLLDHFSEVSSVGGYACRRNTADSSRMSVHGTGRALDVFIPTANGGADNTKGDKVANWLVTHAQRIGVQLVIWDRSIWRANGTNTAAYGGPVPHIDHIHVELTKEASALSTPWFSDMSDAPDASTTATSDAGTDDGASTADAGDAPDAEAPSDDGGTGTTGSPGTNGMTDAGATAKKDASSVDPADDDAPQDTPDAAAPASAGATAPSDGADPSDGLSSAADDPGETDSLPDVPAAKHRSASATDANGDPVPNAGCSTAPNDHAPLRGAGGALALVLGLAAWLRRKPR